MCIRDRYRRAGAARARAHLARARHRRRHGTAASSVCTQSAHAAARPRGISAVRHIVFVPVHRTRGVPRTVFTGLSCRVRVHLGSAGPVHMGQHSPEKPSRAARITTAESSETAPSPGAGDGAVLQCLTNAKEGTPFSRTKPQHKCAAALLRELPSFIAGIVIYRKRPDRHGRGVRKRH